MARRQKGFTLVELIVVMAIFIIVIMITGSAFNSLLKSSVKISKSVETQITDIIGLEVMRVDIKHAGYGLPYYFPTAINYAEALDIANTPVTGVNQKDYNDAPTNPPRPFRLGDNAGINGSDYLAVKSTLLGSGVTAQKWSYVSTGGVLKTWDVTAQNLSSNGENVIVDDPAPNSPSGQQRQLITSKSGGFFYAKYNSGDNYDLLTNYIPTESNQSYIVYGIADATVVAPRMPFNRADYYIRIPAAANMSQRCAPGTGILYKSTLNQDGTFTPIPLLDCVGDMQVVFGLATNAPVDNSVNTYEDSNNLNTGLSLYDLTNQVKEVRLYVLTHEGRMDPNYTYPSADAANPINVGESLLGVQRGSQWTSDGSVGKKLSTTFTNWQHYYWKVLTVVIRPNNL
jgi:prepilin-type N-terminal cleavage/methylation domain-containing protein